MTNAVLGRRRLIVTGGALLLGGLPMPRLAGAATLPANRVFNVFRNNSNIGTHRITFRQAGNEVAVSTALALAVRVLRIVAFRYEQTAEDAWRDGTLIRARISTNDDGTRTEVSLGENGNRLKGTGSVGPIDVALGTMHDLCWYDRRIMERSEVVDAQNGRVNPLIKQPARQETVEAGGRQIAATRYDVTAGQQSGSIWYDADGNWARAFLRTKGEQLEYRLAG